VTFEEFAAAQQRGLLRTAFVLTGDRHLAEDLVQTVLASAWLRWPRIGNLVQREAYVQKMLFTQYVSWRRRHWWGEAPTPVLPDSEAPQPQPELDLARALDALPRRQRAVVVLRYLHDLPERETAEVLGCSVGTVKSQSSKALAALRQSEALNSHDGRSRQHDGGLR
jgi:RNA polymerase sigma-70 factor (sigma-E family)